MVHAAPDDCEIDDESAWRAANPALGDDQVAVEYMRDEVLRGCKWRPERRTESFRALDLNLEISSDKARWSARRTISGPASSATKVPYRGPAYVGLDVGEAGSGTAAAAFWPATGALRTWLAFGSVPSLRDRVASGTAPTIPPWSGGASCESIAGRTVPVKAFVADVRADLAGVKVRGAVADAYKVGELRDCVPWPLTVVRSGAGPDGSAAVRAFQSAVLTGALTLKANLSLSSAIKESTLRRDGNGNPAIDRARSAGRIDVLSAAILAVGAGSKPRAPRSGITRSAICEAVG